MQSCFWINQFVFSLNEIYSIFYKLNPIYSDIIHTTIMHVGTEQMPNPDWAVHFLRPAILTERLLLQQATLADFHNAAYFWRPPILSFE